ncbi:MAG: aldo/keto reductase [Candidatus Poribacteria bacterium]|nr:aldo/keto reductase [Candidatus Poribacteria bacterium]
MKTRILGSTAIAVSELGLGTAFMAGQGQENVNRCVEYAIDQGVNFFDTAANYGKGRDETMLGLALREKRDKIILATKVGHTPAPKGYRDAASLMQQLDGSLERLQTDYVDIIQVHEADFVRWWRDVDISVEADPGDALIADDEAYDFANAPVVEFLKNAQACGKSRFIGLTGKNARLLARILRTVNVDTVLIAHQYNPILRNGAEFLFPTTSARGLGVIGGAVLMKGWLAVPQESWRHHPPKWMDATFHQAYCRYLDLQTETGLHMAELTIRWLLAEKRQHCTLTGFSTLQEVKQNIAFVERGPLPDHLQRQIDEIGIVHPLIYQGRTRL